MSTTKNPKQLKKTIYLDADEEITGVIDKVLGTKEQIVALVIPKRANVFGSVVNMKLLKRSADQNNKKIVLVTSSNNLLPLAGMVGLHVSSNLNSKPYVPIDPTSQKTKIDDQTAEVEVDKPEKQDPEPTLSQEEIEAVEVDNTPKTDESSVKQSKSKIKKDSHGSKLKVPNFNKFRINLAIVGVLFLGSIIFIWWANAVAPKAVVNLRGDTQSKDLSFQIKASTKVTASDLDKKALLSVKKDIKKTETQAVPATGQKDNGTKATGTMSLKNCSKSDGSITIPAGTGASSSGSTFITQADVFLDQSIFTGGGTCISPVKKVGVVAQQGGDKFNLDARSYTMAGFSSVDANGSAMTGGTSQIVKVVSDSDVQVAKSKITDKQSVVTDEVKAALSADGYTPLVDTFSAVDGATNAIPVVNSEASQVTVTIQKTYSMIGIKTDDLKKLIEKLSFEAGVNKTKQSILDDGLGAAIFQLGASNNGVFDVGISNKIIAGPQINQDEIKREIAGKKRGEAESILSRRPGIKEARIDTSPFWSNKVPKKPGKITLIIQDVPKPNDQKP